MRKLPSIKTVAAASALCACVAGAFILLAFWNRSGTVFNLEAKIQIGMTEEEVTALIGGPGGDFPNERNNVWFSMTGAGVPDFGSYSKEWINDNGSVLIVSFNAEGRVVDVNRGAVIPPPPTWFDRSLNACREVFR